MKVTAVLLCLCLSGLAQANIFSDIWHTIEKPLEGAGEAALGAVLKNGLSGVLSLFGKRDLSNLMTHLHGEVTKWLQEAHDLVEQEVTEIGAVLANPNADVSDRIHDLVHDLDLATKFGKPESFVEKYGKDIIKTFIPMLPKRLESKIWTLTHQVSRKTRGNDILIHMLKNITVAHWFFTLPEMERQFLVAMLDATEHGHLHDFIEHITYDRVLLFIDHMPAEEGHKLNHYLVEHLKNENHKNHTVPASHAPAQRDVQEFLVILQEIYSEHFYSLLGKQDRIFLLELMDAAEHGNLTFFLAEVGLERIDKLTEDIPKESSDKFSHFIAESLKKEKEASVSHGSHLHGHHGVARSADILLGILKDIHTADVFFHLPEAERKFMLELMDAAENDHLDPFVKKVTVQRVREFVKSLPNEYQGVMTNYIENHLHHHMVTSTPPTSHPDIMIDILKDIHTATLFLTLPEHARNMVLELLDAAENGHLTEKLADIGMEKLQAFIKHIPSPYDKQLSHYISEHLKAEGAQSDVQARQVVVDIHSILSQVGHHFHQNPHHYTDSHRDFFNQLKHAAENRQLKAFITKVGEDALFRFLNSLPDNFAKTLEQRILTELEEEDHVITERAPRASSHHTYSFHETLHHVGQHMTQNHGHYSTSHHTLYEELKEAVNNKSLKSFINKIGTEKLYDFLNAIPQQYRDYLEGHILEELEKEDHVEV